MRLKNIAFAMVLAFVPVIASAQFKDLDMAMSNLQRGFGGGDPQAIVAGMAGDDQVQLQFPGLVDQSGFYGRDQATYILDGLFNKVKPSGFDTKSARKVSAEGQYHLVANWAIKTAAGTENRELYITLRQKGDGRWSIASVRSAGK
jgi:ketosteroid isomerase-like protein